jgi:hypothetical protein
MGKYRSFVSSNPCALPCAATGRLKSGYFRPNNRDKGLDLGAGDSGHHFEVSADEMRTTFIVLETDEGLRDL